jgi:hypothetical protein
MTAQQPSQTHFRQRAPTVEERTHLVHTHVHVLWSHAPRFFERAAPPQHRHLPLHASEAHKQAAGASPPEECWRWVRRRMHPPIPRHPLDNPEVAVVRAAESHPVENARVRGGGREGSNVSDADHVNVAGRGTAKARWAALIRPQPNQIGKRGPAGENPNLGFCQGCTRSLRGGTATNCEIATCAMRPLHTVAPARSACARTSCQEPRKDLSSYTQRARCAACRCVTGACGAPLPAGARARCPLLSCVSPTPG